jgi:uncharacterized protein (DUF885 family)
MLKRFYACPAVASILLSAMLLSYSGGQVLGATPAADSSIEAPLQSDPAQRLKLLALFEASWQDRMRRSPEWATFNGDDRYGDRLSDVSAAQQAANFALMREELAKARSIDRSALAVKDRTSLDMFIQGNLNQLAYEPLIGFRRLTLGAISGFHLSFASLLQASPTRTTAQVEQILARMEAYPRRVDQEIENLREGLTLGWVTSRPVLDRVVATLDSQLTAKEETSPFFEPFRRLGNEIPKATQDEFKKRALAAIQTHVIPAQRRLYDFVAGEYSAKSPPAGNLLFYPGGAEAYKIAARSQTTTELPPQQIHAIGLREVDRLRAEIDRVMREMNWKGDFQSFALHLNTDPQYIPSSPEALLATYRDIGKRLDAELPKLFAELPRAPYGVRAMPAEVGPDAAENYTRPPLDGTRPGWFNANTLGYKTRPTWSHETLTAHEAVPGHHLQVARAIELGELPQFRRSSFYVAFGEGWATYAETLGFDLGLYRDPASRFGHYQGQIWRAARLVVDTGLHHLGWDRERAINYLVEQTGKERSFMASEVDRYTSQPGQALGYMVGQLKIIELRDRARAALGQRFDIRRFHMAVLDQGAVPLSVLEAQIEAWIASERNRSEQLNR